MAGDDGRRVRVEVWSDLACPWCYLGKRRFEAALARFEHRDRVEVSWRAFQLDPDAPPEHERDLLDLLVGRYRMSRDEVAESHARLTQLGAEVGIDYRFERVRAGSSRDAHRLVKIAGERGLAGEMKERLMRAHFGEGALLSDRETLVRLAAEVGVPAEEARAGLEEDRHADTLAVDAQRARAFGIRGVPVFVFDSQFPVVGAQASDALLDVLGRVWETPPDAPTLRR